MKVYVHFFLLSLGFVVVVVVVVFVLLFVCFFLPPSYTVYCYLFIYLLIFPNKGN